MTRFFNPSTPVHLVLTKNLTRSIKRGHPWVYGQAVKDLPAAAPGSFAILKDKKGERLAAGYYDPESPIVFRVCSLQTFNPNNSGHVERALERCRRHREDGIGEDTNAYRFINGEGDGIPGMICDVYDDTAVMTFDGTGAENFWNAPAFAEWLTGNLGVKNVVVKSRGSGGPAPQVLAGSLREEIEIVENGAKFSVHVAKGQKTGFFLDQRDNRQKIRRIARDRRVLNLFGYTGGFSVYAGLGGAAEVTTVDLSKPAIEAADINWKLNGLEDSKHSGRAADAFDFLESSRVGKKTWDLIVVDPPSFASSEENIPKATKAYEKLFSGACRILENGGLLAASSCSSHIDHESFLTICENAVSMASKRARVIWIGGQPADHPYPLASPEFRYLKFVLLEVVR